MFYHNYRTKWTCNESYRDRVQCRLLVLLSLLHPSYSLVFWNEMAMVHYKLNFLKSVIFFNFRGGPVDSTEELPVKIEVHSYGGLFSRCMPEKKMKVFSTEYYCLKVKTGTYWEVSLWEVPNNSLCQHLVVTSLILSLLPFLSSVSPFVRAPPPPLSLVFPLLFFSLFPSSSACLAFFCLSYICFSWGTAVLAAGPSCRLDTAGMSCVQHMAALAASHGGHLCY